MPAARFPAFLASDDTLRIYRGTKLVFSSKKDSLLPLMEYIASQENEQDSVLIYDKIMGNAAALLAFKVGAAKVFSPLGSKLAVKTLDKYSIKYNLMEVVSFILRDDGQSLCPMEQLSIDKTPEEFYEIMKARIEAGTQLTSPP
jgi:hypothetical protein